MSKKIKKNKKGQKSNKKLLKPKIDVVFHALFRNENKSIIILNHEIKALKGMEDLDVKWQIRDSKTGQRLLTDNLEIVIIEIPKAMRVYEKDKSNRIAQWMMFLNDPNDKEVLKIMEENEGIKETVEELKIVSNDEELRRIAQLREKGIRDEHAAIAYATEQGIEQGLIKTARNMLKKNIEIEEICEITGLTKEKVEKIKIA